MVNSSYHDIFLQHHGKVADKWSAYLESYDRFLKEFQPEPVCVLEIGIQNGGSLELLGQYFPNAQQIVGCDIDQNCGSLAFVDPRISVVIGDATEDYVRDKVLSVSPEYDIIIDDGSHTSSDIIKAFVKYFGSIRPGGMFLAEDLHCSYWQEYGGGLFHTHSAIAFFKRLVDIVNFEHWGVARTPDSILQGFQSRFGIAISEEDLLAVHSVEFTNSICVVRKKGDGEIGLGVRVRAGSEALVISEVLELHGKTCLAPAQNTNPTAISTLPPEEELPQRRLDLVEREVELRNSKEQVAKLSGELQSSKKQVAKLSGELQSSKKQVAQLSGELQSSKEQVAALWVERNRSEAQLAGLSVELKISHAQLAFSHNEITRVIAALTSSTSWRVTGPLRQARCLANQANQAVRRSVSIISNLRRTGPRALEVLRRHVRTKLFGRAASLGSFQLRGTPSAPISYAEWLRANDSVQVRRDWGAQAPLISIVMPTYNSNAEWLVEAIESVRAQTYPRWELCVADDASAAPTVRQVLDSYTSRDPRVKVTYRHANGGISACTRDALALTSGDFVAFLDQDDRLHPDALAAIADVITQDPDVDLLYTDEDKISLLGERACPFFKPDWSPHLALSQAYLGHLVCYRSALLSQFNLRDEVAGAQHYDLWLRASTAARKISHIPRVLYHWRIHQESTSLNPTSKPFAHEAGRRAVGEYLQLRYPDRHLQAVDGDALFTYSVKFALPEDLLISIVIPTKDKVSLLVRCINSIFRKSTWRKYEIIILDNGSHELETAEYFAALKALDAGVKVVEANIPFNWSRLNNIGASHAEGDVLIFLNNDTEVIAPDWMEQLAGYALLPDVGVVGALLLFEDGTIQHSGVVVGMGGWADHVYRAFPAEHDPGGAFVSPVLTRNVTAVTGACTAMARARFDELGGYDDTFIICGSDVELGLRAHKSGYHNVLCAQARLYHLESKTRTPAVPEEDFAQSALKYEPYRTRLRDPFYSPNLTLGKTTPELGP